MKRTTKNSQAGFSMIEVLVALMVLLIGMSGLLAMHLTGLRATSYSRHASEASILGEAQIEKVRMLPPATLIATYTGGADGFVPVPQTESGLNPQGKPGGIYTRVTTVTVIEKDTVANPDVPEIFDILVRVNWAERGTESSDLLFTTRVHGEP